MCPTAPWVGLSPLCNSVRFADILIRVDGSVNWIVAFHDGLKKVTTQCYMFGNILSCDSVCLFKLFTDSVSYVTYIGTKYFLDEVKVLTNQIKNTFILF